MNILYVINALTSGGAQVLLVDLCRHLAAHGHRVHVAAFRDGPARDALAAEGIGVSILGEAFLDLGAARALGRLVEKFQPHLVHSHLFRATLWSRWVLRSSSPAIPLVSSIHGEESTSLHHLEALTAGRSQFLIFPSQYLADWYDRNIHPLRAGRWAVLYPGAPCGPELPQRSPPQDILRIGTLSRLHPVKGLDILLEACSRLRDQGLDFRLVIGGDGPCRQKLEQMVHRAALDGMVRFAGRIDRRNEFLDSLDLLVAPSRSEAFGINVCEALERGLPVIASAVGGLREIVRHGREGLLFEPASAADLAEKILFAAKTPDQVRTLAEQGRHRVCRHFRRDSYVCRHEALYQQLMARNRLQPAPLLVVVSSGGLGGGERVALATSVGLARRGRAIRVLCGPGPLAQQLRRRGLTVDTVSLAAGGVFLALKLWFLCLRHRPIGIHAHLNRAALIGGIIRKLLWISGAAPSLSAHVHGVNRAIYYRAADRLIAVSASVKAHLTDQGLAATAISVIPNRIPGGPVSTSKPSPPPWILAIPAKLHRNKGHDWALAAIEEVAAELPPVEIWILGDGPEESALKARFANGPLGSSLRFWGFQDDMERLYPRIHLVMLPSRGEGIPLTLLEAMKHGIPSLATDVGGIPEIIRHDVSGKLVRPEDKRGWQRGLRECLHPETWQRLSSGARASFARLGTFDDMLDAMERILPRRC